MTCHICSLVLLLGFWKINTLVNIKLYDNMANANVSYMSSHKFEANAKAEMYLYALTPIHHNLNSGI